MTREKVYEFIEAHYREYRSMLIKKYRNALGGHHNAEDAVQEAYTRACKYWQTYDGAQPFGGWFHTILNNCIKDQQRDTILNGLVQESEDNLVGSVPARADDIVLVNEMIARIDKMPEHTAIVLKAAFVWGYTAEEIAEFTPYQISNIRQLISRFRRENAEA